MIDRSRAVLPALDGGCRITVCIPARDEAELIAATLTALGAQRDLAGKPLPSELFDVVVFANNCSDGTAAIVRGVAKDLPRPRISVIERRLSDAAANVGSARKFVLDAAAQRFVAADRPDGVVVSLDADTRPDPAWLACIEREMHGRDAVAGYVTIAPADQARLLAPVRLLYARERAYRDVLAEVEALVDPRPEDPLPRHGSFVGASFAVSAGAYFAAGGLPVRPCLEDLEFARALHRIDARIRYSPNVRAATSARLTARVDGGFGSFLSELEECARRGTSFTVEDPRQTLAELEVRAALRRLHGGRIVDGDVGRISTLLGLQAARWLPLIDATATLGAVYERVAEYAAPRRARYAPIRVETAIDVLRERVQALRPQRRLTPQTSSYDSLDAG